MDADQVDLQVGFILKEAAQDTTLRSSQFEGGVLAVPEGTRLVLDLVAACHNRNATELYSSCSMLIGSNYSQVLVQSHRVPTKSVLGELQQGRLCSILVRSSRMLRSKVSRVSAPHRGAHRAL